MSTDIPTQKFQGNRKYFAVPGGFGVVLAILAVLLFILGMNDGVSYNYRGEREESIFSWMALFFGFCSAAAFKVVHATYIDAIEVRKDGISVVKIPTGETRYPWSQIKKVFADEHALCIQLNSGSNIDVNACFLDFPGLKDALKEAHKKSRPG